MPSSYKAHSWRSTPFTLGAIAVLFALLLPACSAPTAQGGGQGGGQANGGGTGNDQVNDGSDANEGSTVHPDLPGKYVTFDPSVTNPSAYVDQMVVLGGRVRTVYGDSGFLVQDEDTPSPLQDQETASPLRQNSAQSKGVLVLLPHTGSRDVRLPQVGEYVQVKGEVRRFEPTYLEQHYGITWAPAMRSQLQAAYASKLVVIAQEN